MKNKNIITFEKEDKQIFITVLVISLLLIPILFIISSLTLLDILYRITMSIYILFIPGYIITLLFFNSNKIDILEKLVFGLSLSISVVPLSIFYLNFLFKIPISLISVLLIVLGIIIVSFVTKYFTIKYKK